MAVARELAQLGKLLEETEEGLVGAVELAASGKFPDCSAAAAAELFVTFADAQAPAVDALFIVLEHQGEALRLQLLTGQELVVRQPLCVHAVGVFRTGASAAKERWAAQMLQSLAPTPPRPTDENAPSHRRLNPAVLQAIKRAEPTTAPAETSRSKPTLMSFFAKKG